ncbi:Nitrilase family, member 2 [Seminavis robusta]|uniref:Nitrilase family, member 2 n=1 Tax=Seminavis robusta TaxID=568900 RepID=A0A9N8DBD8_9STRA|nr:Nitrilase family, member 2 [Seminavis robusta]|eukprot:Sro23_g015980.1 Nitrilase family, member 2 (307) ;mRNA; f:124776-126287
MKESRRGKAPRELSPKVKSASVWKAPPFPIMDPDCEAEKRPVPLSFSESEDLLLPRDYLPTKYDVINGRGKKAYNHIANRRFRQITAMNVKRYQNTKCKVDKSLIVIGIVNSIRKASPCGGFIKKCQTTGRWISMSDEAAREKVGHCLRDMIASKRDEKSKQAKVAAKEEAALNAAMPKMPISTHLANANSKPRAGMPQSRRTPSKQSSKSTAGMTGGRSQAYVATSTALEPVGNFARQPPIPVSFNQQPSVAVERRTKPISSSLNNFDNISAKGTQDMSEQQRRILKLLEGGWKGSIEDLIKLAS